MNKMGVEAPDSLKNLSLPPGFRFYPTDEELLVQYLCRKVAGQDFDLQIIAEIDLYKFDPWVLPSKAIFGEKEWYFFSPRDRKYPNGSRPNRVAASGYWKATGTDKPIITDGKKVGIKKALVFYIGKAPKGTKTNWIMHEYRLYERKAKTGTSRLDDWVLCRIYKKKPSGTKQSVSDVQSNKEMSHGGSGSSSSSSSQFDDMLESLQAIEDQYFSLPPTMNLQQDDDNNNNNNNKNKFNLQQQLGSGSFDWANLASFYQAPVMAQNQNNNNNNNFVNYNEFFANPTALNFHGGVKYEEEVESSVIAQRVNNSGFFQEKNGFPGMVPDPFGIRYPAQTVNMGFTL